MRRKLLRRFERHPIILPHFVISVAMASSIVVGRPIYCFVAMFHPGTAMREVVSDVTSGEQCFATSTLSNLEQASGVSDLNIVKLYQLSSGLGMSSLSHLLAQLCCERVVSMRPNSGHGPWLTVIPGVRRVILLPLGSQRSSDTQTVPEAIQYSDSDTCERARPVRR